MRLWKRFAALLTAALLLMSMLPVAFAADNGETETDLSDVPAQINDDTEESLPEEGSADTEKEESKPEETTAPTSAASTVSSRVDYTELRLQLAMVSGLTEHDYTAESWAPLQEAYEKGKRTLDGKYGQRSTDTAAADIKEAIAQLVTMDYSPLENALVEIYSLIKEAPELHDVWVQLDAAVAESKPLLVSGDQEAVNAAAAKINALLEEYQQYADVEQPPEVIVQEVEVEVLPTGDYCNIPMHRTWPVLFVVSAVLNVALVVLLVYVIVKKRNTTDDTPLVSYDIDDDMDY